MKYTPNTQKTALNSEIINKLDAYRASRHFNPDLYIKDKAQLLNRYMKASGLKTCVVAVSGGIDSAAVLGLAKQASLMDDSPIEKILAVTLPVYADGATNQEGTVSKARELSVAMRVELVEIEISDIFKSIYSQVESKIGVEGEKWGRGQLVAYSRTPTLYYVTSLMSEAGTPAIILGTNNKDEGAYLGFFGKASDGMVDVQMISDIHKSEVYQISEIMGVPDSILEAKPTGDMYDAREDEEVFGAPYDFVELYLGYLEDKVTTDGLSDMAMEEFNQLASNLEALHNYNGHKYISGSPAVHLDVEQYEYTIVKGNGWRYFTWK